MREVLASRWFVLPVFFVGVIAVGCSNDATPTSRSSIPTSPVPPTPKMIEAGAPRVEIKRIKASEYEPFIKSHKGKVVMVDFWFLGCLPCRRAFPHLVEMHEKYGKDGFVLITVNTDNPKDHDLQAGALEFLKERNATNINIGVVQGETFELWNDRLNLDVVAFPTTLIFDRDGKLHKRFVGAPPAELEAEIIPLLKPEK